TGWQGAVFQIALLILVIFMYIPIIKMLDKQYLREEDETVEEEDDDISFDDLVL
ncbi:PTS cellobiose transporter subunit IIC, partial [Clostridioides difficile]|nr:PTS cellobiose transporter subunit IIC [Clostridioides difficile]